MGNFWKRIQKTGKTEKDFKNDLAEALRFLPGVQQYLQTYAMKIEDFNYRTEGTSLVCECSYGTMATLRIRIMEDSYDMEFNDEYKKELRRYDKSTGIENYRKITSMLQVATYKRDKELLEKVDIELNCQGSVLKRTTDISCREYGEMGQDIATLDACGEKSDMGRYRDYKEYGERDEKRVLDCISGSHYKNQCLKYGKAPEMEVEK